MSHHHNTHTGKIKKSSPTRRAAWGRGKFEVTVLKNDILALIQCGLSKAEIFKKFQNEGKLTLKYSAFAGHVAKFQNNENPYFKNNSNAGPFTKDTFIEGQNKSDAGLWNSREQSE